MRTSCPNVQSGPKTPTLRLSYAYLFLLMPFLDRLESRFGRFAIPSLVQFVAGLQLLTFVIFIMLPAEGQSRYYVFLTLNAGKVLQGEIWRLVTYIFLPTSLNPFFAIIGAMFLMWLGRGLEQAWGAFRLNLYFYGGMAAVALGTLIFGFDEGNIWLLQTLLLAFAMIYPNEEIYLFMILPVKIKWIAWLSVVQLVLSVIATPISIVPIVFAHLNFLITFGPGFVRDRMHSAKVAERRTRFEEFSSSGAAYFHQCSVCKKTEVDDASLDFRVNADGDEICSACRKAAS